MGKRILFVDDDVNLLASYRRQFGKRYDVHLAAGGDDGLRVIEQHRPCPVVIADMSMPGMNGAEFLTRVRAVSPDTVRIMLTGHADVSTAVAAVNQGQIFRFLTKPCPRETLETTILAGLEQYRLITAERELLERTLRGSVWTLVEIMGLVNPAVFSRATRMRNYAREVLKEMELPQSWRYELAAMLSQIGAVTLPPALLERVEAGAVLTPDEQKMFDSRAAVGARLVGSIPRLEPIADMIQGQLTGTVPAEKRLSDETEIDAAAFGAKLLRTVQRLDTLVQRGATLADAIDELGDHGQGMGLDVLSALRASLRKRAAVETRMVTVADLVTGMIVDEEVRASDGTALVPKGQEVTYAVLSRLQNFAAGVGVVEPFRVRMPDAPAESAAA
jgi:response regulator RpfG family c-di-GMP phosphodiesterase